jgi:hypothetical protein
MESSCCTRSTYNEWMRASFVERLELVRRVVKDRDRSRLHYDLAILAQDGPAIFAHFGSLIRTRRVLASIRVSSPIRLAFPLRTSCALPMVPRDQSNQRARFWGY